MAAPEKATWLGWYGFACRVLRPDGKPCYKRPIWLFWSGPETTLLEDLCRMYLWRFSIEHCFRFLKQHLGLHANQSKNLVSTDQWIGAALWFIGNYCSCEMLWKTANLPGILHNLPLIPAKEHPVISPTCQIALRLALLHQFLRFKRNLALSSTFLKSRCYEH